MANEIQTNAVEVQQAVDAALQEQKKKKKKKKLIILLAVVVIAIIGIVVSSSGNSDEDTTPTMTITADEVIADYKSNELSANEKYQNKYATITECTVKGIDDGLFYVEAKDEDLWLYEIVVYYNDDQKNTVLALSENDVVSISGKITGTDIFGDVKVENSIIEVNE